MKQFFCVLVLAFICNEQASAARHPSARGHETAPYHVHMLIYDQYMAEWPASGVLVTRQHVLTAAVNVHNYNRWDLGFGSETQRNLLLIKSFNAYVHEHFNDTTDDNNVGLIVMPEAIETSGKFRRIMTTVRPLKTDKHSSRHFLRSHCTDRVATSKRALSTGRRCRPRCRLHANQWRWTIVEATQSWGTKNCQRCRMRSSLSPLERHCSAFLLRPWRLFQCMRWRPGKRIGCQTKWKISFSRHRVIRKHLARLRQPFATRFRSHCRICRLDRKQN